MARHLGNVCTKRLRDYSDLHIKCKINNACGHCRANTDKMATNIILFTFSGNTLRMYPMILTKNGTTHGTTPGKFLHKSLRDYSDLHIKCKTNHVCGHSTRYLSCKYRQNGYKYHFIYLYLQWFENLS